VSDTLGTGPHDWATPGGSGDQSVGPTPESPSQLGSPASYAPPAPVVVTAVRAAQAAPTYRSWQPGIIPLRPMSFGEFISVPFKAMRFNRAVVIGGPLLFVGASMVVLAAALWLAFTDPSLGLLSPTSQFSGIQGSTIAVSVAALVTLILADALSSAIVAPGVARAVLGERIPVGEALRAVGSRVWQLLLLWLLTSLALALALAPGIAAAWLGGVNGDGGVVALGVVAALVLGLVIGVPVYLISTVARCVIVLERTGAVESVRRTVGLIKGRFWWSFLIVFVTGLIINIVTGVVQQLVGTVGNVAILIGVSGEWVATAIGVAVYVLGAVVTYVVTYAYMGAVYSLIYIDLRIRHEGFDMDLARAAEARRG
jgi:hypothetical protein